MRGRTSSFLFIIFLLSVLNGILSVRSFLNDEPMKLELIHRNSLRDEMPKTQLELIQELQRHDLIRHQMISRRGQHHHHHISTGIRRFALEKASIAMPLSSAWDFGTGQYLVQIKVGTPSQRFLLIADTGSDLTWMRCKYGCGGKCGLKRAKLKKNKKKVFRPAQSSTFKTIPCSSDMCKFELDFSRKECPTPSSPCKYDYRYAENSGALGFFANETIRVPLTNGRRAKLNDVLIGCTETIEGPKEASIRAGDGILGLGLGKHSFVGKAASNLGDKFSYCLVDHMSHKNVSSYLTFGRLAEPAEQKNMIYTKLAFGGPKIGPFYAVNLAGISIEGKMLMIPDEVWTENRGGGTIVDSGTSLTFLSMPAYIPVMEELTRALSKYEKISLDAFEFCFNSTAYQESSVPRFAVHFADGAKFEPPVKSYVIDVAVQTKCLGFLSTLFPGTIVIGNIMQQNYLWEFDLREGKLGFAPSSCT
ncbi:aspartic proteinase NANA, chloroplast-like [Argentina anserina]|uniref:aspartic proteinase NANA, chloroplast-like n=1 Tax=Argentina anserina TaxID=57926 RepID=UPI00217624EB|nr:aspartic proteinase NANA, chloroplast-like [Potentilla anserina]